MQKLSALCIVMALAFWNLSNAEAEPKIKIGVSTALTGPAATFGNDIKNALLFANNELTNNKYDIVIEDDRCNGKDAVSVAHKMIDVHKVKYVFTNCSATTLSAAAVYDRAGVLMFAPLATSPDIAKASDNIFRAAPSDEANARMLYEYIVARYQKVGILTEQSDYSENFRQAFVANNAGNKLEISSESYLPTDNDFRTILLRYKQLGVKALFINSNTEQSFLLILKQLREGGHSFDIFGSYISGSASFLQQAGKGAEGIIFTDFPPIAEVLTPNGTNLLDKFQREYGPINSWNIVLPTTFELLRALDQAISSGEDVKAYLYRTEFTGIFGKYQFDQNGDIVGLRHSLNQIRDGKIVQIH